MSKPFWISLIIAILTPGLVARSQTASIGDSARLEVSSVVEKGVEAPADTMHITPAMIDSIMANKRVEEFERHLDAVTFIPKGQWIAGISVSYDQGNYNDYQFLVLQNVRGDTYSLNVSPKVLYAFHKDMAIGLRFSYSRSLTKLENMEVSLGSDTEFDVKHLHSLGHNYYGTILFRNYFSLGHTKRFGVFNEVQLQLGGGQSRISNGRGESLTGTYERNFSANLGIVPGIVVFLNNYSAIEVNVGVLGFNYRHTKSIRDQVYISHRKSQSVNFRINLFSITFGAAFYL